jgi:hypothetical protein
MEGRRKDGVEKGTQQCPSVSKGSETGGLVNIMETV